MNDREEFVANFRELPPRFSRLYTRLLEEVDLTLPQFALLNQLAFTDSVSMTEISTRLQITKPAVTNLVDRLEGKKFLRRNPFAEDRRVILLEILPKGKKIIAKTQACTLKVLLKAYDQFDLSERKTISRFYVTVSKVMDDFLKRARHEN